jgi:hypothetical protein
MEDRAMPRISRGIAVILILTGLGAWAGQHVMAAETTPGTPANSWRQVAAQGPAARWGHVAVYDPDGARVLVFGGSGQASNLGDVWEFSLNTETWRDITPKGTGPSSRFTAGAVADPPRRRTVVVGGYTGYDSSDEVWAFSFVTNEWARLPSGPSARFDLAMTASPEKAWVYGGFKNFEEALGDLWELDLRTDTWRQLPVGPPQPAPRTNLTFGFDAPSNRLYLFGGHDQHPTPHADTWAYDVTASRWTPLSPGGAVPEVVTHQAYIFDAACRALWMMGGDRNNQRNVATTWVLNINPLRFVRIQAAAEPPPRQHAAMAMDAGGRLILFGGRDGEQRLLSDTWILEPKPRCP